MLCIRTTAARRWTALALLLAAACARMAPVPEIEVTHTPAWGSDENLSGKALGLDPATHHVAVALFVEGAGWWSKASWESSGEIEPDGSFDVDVTTGGRDREATGYWIGVFPDSEQETTLRGAEEIPAELREEAIVASELTRDRPENWEPMRVILENRVVEFAGRRWAIKESTGPVGPGDNWFSGREEDIWVDEAGLHLTIRERDGRWWCTEAILLESLGHGTYVFHTASRVDIYDPEVVGGIFTWDTAADWKPGGSADEWPYREIDIEYSRWGDPEEPTNAHFAVQPWFVEGNTHRHTVPDLSEDQRLTGIWTWRPDRIEFIAALGHHAPGHIPEEAVLRRWTYEHDPAQDHWVPDEGTEQVRFNLWLNTTAMNRPGPPAPRDGQPVELLITDFQFHPLDESAETTD